jgi:hypothetical protein
MKKLLFVSFLITGLVFISCKKSSTTTGGGGSTTNNSTNISPSNATSYYGILNTYNIQSVTSGTLSTVLKYASAFFSNTPTHYLNTSTFVKVSSVTINGDTGQFSSFYYTNSTYSLSFPPATWKVNGLAAIPSFTYTNNNTMPSYTGYSTLPDTVYKNQPIIISVTGITGADEVTVGINDGSNAAGHSIAQMLTAGATSVTFPASSLSTLNITNAAFINIECQKNNVQSINSLPMNFETTYELNKTISIK